ncbi:hypothetical protein C2U72_06805 [Prosthecomicrobium hirschii]|nr:hypothetical protein C2U72_06805 [Prosthecomicrobium hirschii]
MALSKMQRVTGTIGVVAPPLAGANEMPKRAFNLRLWFAVCALGTIAAVSAMSAYAVTDFLTTSLLEREAEVSQEFMESIIRVDGAAMFGGETSQQEQSLSYYASHIMSMPGIIRVNIYSADRRMLWSNEKQLIGQVYNDNQELVAASKGQRVTEIGSVSGDTKAEHVALAETGHFVEAYIPIREDRGQGKVLGIVEIYKLPQSLDATIRSATAIVWFAAALSALLLYSSLYWIVQRGALLIERQQDNIGRMEAFAAIGQMASAVAHSLRNPMASIRSSAELWHSGLPPDERWAAAEVIAEVDRMDGYVRDLLAYARAEPYQLQAVDFAKVAGRVIGKYAQAIKRYRIEVAGGIEATPVRVMADEMLLEQALNSIVTNAIEAMPTGGRLDLSVVPATEADRVRIAVVDSGAGIPGEIIDRVAHSYFTTKARGLGLGLVLAKGIIERFGGQLTIASQPGAGTTVAIELRSA